MASYEMALSLPSQNESHCSVANVCLFETTINIILNNAFFPHASLWLSWKLRTGIGILYLLPLCPLLQYAPTQETRAQE